VADYDLSDELADYIDGDLPGTGSCWFGYWVWWLYGQWFRRLIRELADCMAGNEVSCWLSWLMPWPKIYPFHLLNWLTLCNCSGLNSDMQLLVYSRVSRFWNYNGNIV
jgi:hypothetical protein